MFKYKRVLAALLLQVILVGVGLAADVEWRPTAQNTPQIDTYTVTGTWAAGVPDTASITCNNKTLTVSVGSDTAVADIADIIARMVNATSAVEDIKTDETRNNGGYEYGEFRDVIASTDGADLIFTSAELADGSYPPFTITVGETTAGSGTLGSVVATQLATGKHHFNAPKNWVGGSVPVTTDTLVFADGSEDLRWWLNQTSAVTALGIDRKSTYGGTIGLKPINTNWSGHTYPEYRARELLMTNGAGTSQSIVLGERHSVLNAKGETFLDLGIVTGSLCAVQVHSGTAQVVGGKAVLYRATGGSLQIGGVPSDTAPEIGLIGVQGKTTYVRATSHATATTGATVTVDDGTVVFEAAGVDTDVTQYGGTLTIDKTNNTVDLLAVHGGVCNLLTNTTTIIVYGEGVISSIPTAQLTFANVTMHKGGSFLSPNVLPALTNGIILDGCKLSDVTIDLPAHLKWTPSAGP